MIDLTIIVPTFNEAPNVVPLLGRIAAATSSMNVSVIFVDDSTDDTPAVITSAISTATIPVRLIHRQKANGGLSGAVLEGFAASTTDWCLVMDGDLQHPPELIPVLAETASTGEFDVVVASRYIGGGAADGLSSRLRRAVSTSGTSLTRAMFPKRLRDCTDPMTGFFLVRRSTVDVSTLRPMGFKILLEILARQPLKVAEEPFLFGARAAGKSKANLAQGLHFLRQLFALRFGKMSIFAVVGGIGAVANIAIMALLTHFGMSYILAAIIAAELTIVGNFALLERFVFADMREEGKGMGKRFLQSVTFNNAEAALRIPILYLLVSGLHFGSVIAASMTLAAAFVVRFLFHSRVVYAPRRSSSVAPSIDRIDGTAVPGKLDRA